MVLWLSIVSEESRCGYHPFGILYILYSSAGGAHTPRHKNSPENSRFSKKESKEETGIERQSIGTNATSIIVSPKIQHG